MTQEPRPTPEVFWKLEWYCKGTSMHCKRLFDDEYRAAYYRDAIEREGGEAIKLEAYVRRDLSQVILTPEQVERARMLLTRYDMLVGRHGDVSATAIVDLLREITGNE